MTDEQRSERRVDAFCMACGLAVITGGAFAIGFVLGMAHMINVVMQIRFFN